MNETEYRSMIRNAFNEASKGYDLPAMCFFDKSAAHLVEQLPLRDGDHVLDVATGTGKIALLVAKRLKKGRVTGIDLSEGMLARAREKARLEGVNNVSFECMDIGDANFPEGSMDGLTCGFGVFFWMDMKGTLKKLLSLIKPGGFVAITSFAAGSFKPLSELCLARFEKFGVQLPKTYTWEKLDHPEKHQQLLKEVGLSHMDSHAAPMGYTLANAMEWWDIVYNSGFRGFLNQLSSDKAAQYKEEHLQEISDYASHAGLDLKVDVIFTTARAPRTPLRRLK